MNRKAVKQSNVYKMFSKERESQPHRQGDHSGAPTSSQLGYPPPSSQLFYSGHPYHQPPLYLNYPPFAPPARFPGGYAGWWGSVSYPNSSRNEEALNGGSSRHAYGNFAQISHLHTKVPHPHYHNTSSASLEQKTDAHEGSAHQAEKGAQSWWTTTPYGQNYPRNRKISSSSLHNASHGSSSRAYPTTSTHAYAQEEVDSNSAEYLPQPAPYQLSPLLNAQQKEYPSIDWNVWNVIHSASVWAGKGIKGDLDMKKEAFVGTVEVREPIFITSFPEKKGTFSLAITRWKPIVVLPQGPRSTIKIGDVMIATFLWLNEPIKKDEWATFDENLRRMVIDSFDKRRAHARTQTAVVGPAEDNARRVDMLLCRVRWNGIFLADNFAQSKEVYLHLLDATPELSKET